MTNSTETAFIKEQFEWDGMYLMYKGLHSKSVNYEEVFPNCHPSNIGKNKPEFIARFKYGSKPWKSYRNFICKNFTVEEYLRLSEATSARQAMESKGYRGR